LAFKLGRDVFERLFENDWSLAFEMAFNGNAWKDEKEWNKCVA